MNDKELLELAAKAAGLTNLVYCPAWKCMAEMLGVNYERVVWAIKRYGDGWHDYIVRAAAEIGKAIP